MTLDELQELIYEEPCVVLMIGPSGSGKSTLAEKLARDEDHIISSDHMRKRLTGDATNQEITGKAYSMVHQFLENRCKHDCVTFVDATNLKISNRDGVLSTARDKNEDFRAIAVTVEAEKETLKERQKLRDRSVPEHVIEKHAARYETSNGQLQGEEQEKYDQVFKFYSESRQLEEVE